MSNQIPSPIDTSGFFAHLFAHARQNSVVIMEPDGTILAVNGAFSAAFGYREEDIVGRNHRLLFIPEDRSVLRPELELETVLAQKQASDDAYLVHADGTYIWVTGESILAASGEGAPYIVKVIHDIHAQKLLEQYISEANRLIDMIFGSVQDTALIVVDMRLNVIRLNEAFRQLFGLEAVSAEGGLLPELGHPLWADEALHRQIREAIGRNSAGEQTFEWTEGRKKHRVLVQFKPLEAYGGVSKRVLLVVSR